MRYIMCAALAATSLATPALAKDHSWYAGVEGGLLWPRDATVKADDGFTSFDYVDINYKRGIDADLIAGYDFGWVRLEGELGYKRAKHDNYRVAFIDEGGIGAESVVDGFDINGHGSTRVWSGMLNALLDANVGPRFAIYAGGGVGYHSTRMKIAFDQIFIGQGTIKDNGLAWQLIAGARYAVSDNIDLGLKYRYFRTDRLKDSGFENEYDVSTHFASHSLLASLIYNFAPPPPPPPPPAPPPPPPPPPPPATQTCPDGSVILATDACPPPPPPPPPPPEPERG